MCLSMFLEFFESHFKFNYSGVSYRSAFLIENLSFVRSVDLLRISNNDDSPSKGFYVILLLCIFMGLEM